MEPGGRDGGGGGSSGFDASATTRRHEERECGCGFLFPAAKGGPMVYPTFHQWWIKAADAVGWPMIKPLTRTRAYGKDPKKGPGVRYTGQAQWTPHDLRHNADYIRKTYAGTRGTWTKPSPTSPRTGKCGR